MKPVILSWSGGKDSTASIILAHEHGIRIDEILMAEVMFDKNFTAENPLHMKWAHETAKPLFESWGYKVTILRSQKTYLDMFHHVIRKASLHPEHVGMEYGFPVFGLCHIRRDCKIRVLERYLRKNCPDGYDQVMGLCADEPKRLASMRSKPGAFSILEQFGYTERMARELCEEYGLLSPAYKFSDRQGCFACPNARIEELEYIKHNHPDVWRQFVALEGVSRIAFDKWNPFRPSLAEIDAII